MPDADKCRTCSAPVLWVRMAGSGKRMPLDAEPSARGNVRVVEGMATVLGAEDATGARAAGEELYLSHFVLCPDRRAWKKVVQ